MTAERLVDYYGRISFLRPRIWRIRISFCPSSSSATPIGLPSYGLMFVGGRAFERRKRNAARGWLQRLVRLYRLLVRESHQATGGVVYFGSNREATSMIGRIQGEGFDWEGIYFTNAEGMRAGCGRNDRGSSYNSFFIRRRLLTETGRNPVEPILYSARPLKSSQSEPMVVCRVCRQLQNTEFTHPPEATS